MSTGSPRKWAGITSVRRNVWVSRNGMVACAGDLLGGEVGLPQVGTEHLVLDVAGRYAPVDERAADRLHERQGTAQVVARAVRQLDLVEVHLPGVDLGRQPVRH